MVAKSCKGSTCVDPWRVLHPNGDVKSLKGALDQDYDAFYAFMGTRVKFDECRMGYIVDSEGPQSALVFGVDFNE
jgi:N-acetylglucosamine-6-sulfatase